MFYNQSQHFNPIQRHRLYHPRTNWLKNHSSLPNQIHFLQAMRLPLLLKMPLHKTCKAVHLLLGVAHSWLFLLCKPTLYLLLDCSLLVLTQAPNLSPSYRSPLTPLQGAVPSLPPRGHLSIRQRRVQQAHPTLRHHPAPALEECLGEHGSTQSRTASWDLLVSIAGNCKVCLFSKYGRSI